MAKLSDVTFKIKAQDQASKPLKDVGKSTTNLKSKVNNLKPALFAASAAFASVAAVATKATNEFAEYQSALKRVDTNLKLVGVTAKGATQAFADIATNIQSVTVLSDNAALEIQALFLALGAAPQQLELATQTAADVAAATGKSVEEVGRQIAKTLGGFAGELGETIPALKELTKEQLQAGAAIELLADRFGGAALEEARTLKGEMTQLSNSVSDLFKAIGGLLSTETAIGSFFGFLTKQIQNVTLALGGGSEEQRLTRQLNKLNEEFANLATFGTKSLSAKERLAGLEPRTLQQVQAEIDGILKKLIEVKTSRQDSLTAAQEQFEAAKRERDAINAAAKARKDAVKEEEKLLKAREAYNRALGLSGIGDQAQAAIATGNVENIRELARVFEAERQNIDLRAAQTAEQFNQAAALENVYRNNIQALNNSATQ